MKKHIWAWVIGGVLFFAIAGIWAWQLPNTIKRIGGLHDERVGAIMSVFQNTKNSLSPDLIKAKEKLDANLKQVSQTMKAQAVRAAVIEDLKNKIGDKNNIQAATVPPTTLPPSPIKK